MILLCLLFFRRDEWYREDCVFNIFIQRQYPLLMDTFTKDSKISYEQLTRYFTRIEDSKNVVKLNQVKISLNINQLIKSTQEIFNRWLFIDKNQSIR